MSVALRRESPRTLVCGECGSEFTLSASVARRTRRSGRTPICGECRRVHPRVTPELLDAGREWWLTESGLSLEDIQEIARMCFPELVPRPALTLVGS